MSLTTSEDSLQYDNVSSSAIQFAPWSLTMDRARKVGDGLDNAMMKSFWSSMQIELLNRML